MLQLIVGTRDCMASAPAALIAHLENGREPDASCRLEYVELPQLERVLRERGNVDLADELLDVLAHCPYDALRRCHLLVTRDGAGLAIRSTRPGIEAPEYVIPWPLGEGVLIRDADRRLTLYVRHERADEQLADL